MNSMIENAKKAAFQLPVFIIPLIAFGLNIIGDMIGGSLAIAAFDRLNITGSTANRILLLSVAINALLILLWVKFVERRSIGSIGLCKRSMCKDSAIGAAAGLGSFAVILVIGYAVRIAAYQPVKYSVSNTIDVFLMIPFWVIQAGAEEILTRGWVLPEVSAKSNRLVGVLVSSALFVILHIDNLGLNAVAIINIFLIGVLLALYTLKSDSLWGAIMFHAFWNFTQGSLFGLSVSGGSGTSPCLMNFVSRGDVLLSGGRFGIEASIITTAVIVLLSAAFLLTDKSHLLQTMLIKHGNRD